MILYREAFPSPPERDTAISHALLRHVAEGLVPESLRLHRPGDIVAFGPTDRLQPGYRDAVAASYAKGFGAVERLAGGRAAVFHGGTIAFAWCIPMADSRDGIRSRFEALAWIMCEAFVSLGVDARVGEVPGEYCAGEYSVNARGRTKLMGVGQRLVRGAAHVGGVVVVSGSERVRDVLVPVYAALGLDWDATTVGSLEDEVAGVTREEALKAIETSFGALDERPLPASVIDLASQLEARHRPAP